MYLILFVLNDPDRLEDLLIAWEENGVEGATVLFSTGLGRIRELDAWRDDMPLIPSLRDFYELPENMNRTIFTIVKEEAQVDAVVAATKKIVGELDERETGLLLVLPVARAYGAKKRKET
jgi:nitrogen regulatory protein P-II 1